MRLSVRVKPAPDLHLSGTVRGVQTRTEVSGGGSFSTSSSTTLVFRLEPLDGGRPVNVQISGSRLDGTVVDGEVVDVSGRLKAQGVIEAVRVVSRDTGATIEAPELPELPSGCRFVFGAIALLVVLGVIGVVVLIVVTA